MTREVPVLEGRPVRVGNYQFTGRILGEGSFGKVEEAIHTRLKVKVSVKNIDMVKCNSYVRKNFMREANVLHQLNHPNILRLFETMKYGHNYCLVAELLPGGDLCNYVMQQRNRRLDEHTHRRISRQIVAALGYLHASGIVHRDLKLENIMLDFRKEHIKLVDFGLSNHWKDDCPLKTLCGSPEYCAPELFITGTQYGPEVDMWALGVVMYAMAVGSLPFPNVSVSMRTSEKWDKLLRAINQGLSTNHINCIKGYPTEFIALLKSLMNPRCEKRVTVKDTLVDAWISNKNRWSMAPNDSLDAYEIQEIQREVCELLQITDERLKTHLQSQPYGDVAGVYNIIYHKRNSSNRDNVINGTSKTSTSSVTIDKSTKRVEKDAHVNRALNNKLSIAGVANRLNEVVKGRKKLQRSIYTSATSSSQQSSERSVKSGQLYKFGKDLLTPRIGPLKVKILNSPLDISSSNLSTVEDAIKYQRKSKEKNVRLYQPELPSRLY